MHIYFFWGGGRWGDVLGLSCNMWDLVPWPGNEPGSPALGMGSLSHWTVRVPFCELKPRDTLSDIIHMVVLIVSSDTVSCLCLLWICAGMFICTLVCLCLRSGNLLQGHLARPEQPLVVVVQGGWFWNQISVDTEGQLHLARCLRRPGALSAHRLPSVMDMCWAGRKHVWLRKAV